MSRFMSRYLPGIIGVFRRCLCLNQLLGETGVARLYPVRPVVDVLSAQYPKYSISDVSNEVPIQPWQHAATKNLSVSYQTSVERISHHVTFHLSF